MFSFNGSYKKNPDTKLKKMSMTQSRVGGKDGEDGEDDGDDEVVREYEPEGEG